MSSLKDFDAESVPLTKRQKAGLLKRYALHCKYGEAVELYADTDKPLAAIAEICQVSVGGLGSYLRRYWRELVLRRNRIQATDEQKEHIKIKAVGMQNVNAHAKYKEAVAACDSLDYIDLNLSQVARKFGLDGTSLANFMRVHYEDTLVWREKLRNWLGIDDNIRRGARPACIQRYAEAVRLYRDTDDTLAEIAAQCEVSEGGLIQHLRFYHKELLKQKRIQRRDANGRKLPGNLTGNGRLYRPSCRTEQRYAVALALYRDTALTMKEIVSRAGVPAEGFRAYLHKWHKELVWERAGMTGPVDEHVNLRCERRRMKTVSAKYEEAIASLKRKPRPVAQVAAEFHLHPDTFRSYLHKHEPELAQCLGMTRTAGGKKVLRRSEEKYAEAVRLYATTGETLKSISGRLGLNWNSLGGYMRRNCPEVLRRRGRKSGK